jgi:hypothetical protein
MGVETATSEKDRKWALYRAVGGLMLVFIGTIGLWNTLSEVIEGYATSVWPSTSGTIQRFAIESEVRQKGTGAVTEYFPSIDYAYQVNGVGHIGHKVYATDEPSTYPSRFASIKQRLKPGMQVAVYYDPSNPNRAVLERGPEPIFVLGVFLSVALLVIGEVLARDNWRKYSRPLRPTDNAAT